MNERTPRNTSADDVFGKLLTATEPGGIEAQEAQGQRELVNSEVLPTEGSRSPELIELGFTFGDEVEGDPLFRHATLPEGWKREGSDHAMHSYIVDERGIRRVNVFYKAAFYDRRADMHVINVGNHVATDWIYGDGEPDPLHSQLTAEELADVKASAEHYTERAQKDPGIYGDRVPRAESLLRAVAERTGEAS